MFTNRGSVLAQSIIVGYLLAFASACDRVSSVDPRWESVISAHTDGLISKRDNIRILFASNVADADMSGRPAVGMLTFKPEIEGVATFVDGRELLFEPEAELPSGRSYVATLAGDALSGVPADIPAYRFTFAVIPQDYQVTVDGLEIDEQSGRIDDLVLTGRITTADFADTVAVQEILGARQAGTDLNIRWDHDDNGTIHRFTVAGITRTDEEDAVTLRWSGRSIDSSTRGRQDVTVPTQDAFQVIGVSTALDGRHLALVRFSKRIDPGQSFEGLVGLGDELFTLEVLGSTLRIIPRDRVVGTLNVVVEPGIESVDGQRLEEQSVHSVTFSDVKPGVRFAGSGVVLPEASRLTVPIEASNVHSVQITAFRVYESNIGQFLQRNDLAGSSELRRTGRTLWRRTFELPEAQDSDWARYVLDLTDIADLNPESLLRLTLSINRGNSTYPCTEEQNSVPVVVEPLQPDQDDQASYFSSWRYWNNHLGEYSWGDRENPCTDAYYRYASEVSDSRNYLASNLGMTVKRDPEGGMLVAVTDLRSSSPLGGVNVTFMNYQNQPLLSVITGDDGLARTSLDAQPYYVVADNGAYKGYLKVNPGGAMQTSHFDVGGEVVADGLKGRIYGERGVWRPGDDIHLTFVLDDTRNPLPLNHPATISFFNPMGQVVRTETNANPVGGFYVFHLNTSADAPTGNWNAAVEVGGARFTLPIRIETVMPNRLKVELDLGDEEYLQGGEESRVALSGEWLSGAVARNLRAEVEVAYRSVATSFSRFSDFAFDDPAREFAGEPATVFDGTLDQNGHAAFSTELTLGSQSPGMMSAAFTTRIFEEGGAFSTNRRVKEFSPYDRYIGIRPPPGDATRGLLLTDSLHTVEIVSVAPDGEDVSVEEVEVTLYKIDWRWWWDSSDESLAQFTESENTSVVAQGRVATVNGRGSWDFQVNHPEWGRYLLRACDVSNGHCTGKTIYIDWPGWAGRARDQRDLGASMLTLSSDKSNYDVGDIAEIQLPDASSGRALVTLETGTKILDQWWVEFSGERVRFEVPITPPMVPNVYVSVSLIQPHSERINDRPIRLFGVVPLEVEDPQTVLHPEIGVPAEWRPNNTVNVRVSEASGRPMTYTLAVVDEGLLNLTNFNTPDLHDDFYTKEALGVATWDIFDEVAGAYTVELERLLAIGGDEAGTLQEDERSRFPPVVRFMGPFSLRSGARQTHTVDLPQYIGQVRVMVVAGHNGAYGSASESVFVRDPLSLLATVPRVVGPGETFAVPVSLFVMEDSIEQANVTVDPGPQFEAVGSNSTTVQFAGADEAMARLQLQAGQQPGQGVVRFAATSGEHSSQSEIALNIRVPNPTSTRLIAGQIAPGQQWTENIVPHGIPGTSEVRLEVTSVPPLNLEARLKYLLRYPHGCAEQITSRAFPQLYLPLLADLTPEERMRAEKNVRAAIDRLYNFQVSSGGFSYWPGSYSGRAARNGWVTSYVGHFMIEAERQGFYIDPVILSRWELHQRSRARSWRRNDDTPAKEQAYRLYTLALAGEYEIGAMNRLRETDDIDGTSRWYLASAYSHAGIDVTASELISGSDTAAEYEKPGWSMGSVLRDSGILLDALVSLQRDAQAERVAEDISSMLSSDDWYSTHSLAYALYAMTRYFGIEDAPSELTFDRRAGADTGSVRTTSLIHSEELPLIAEQGGQVQVTNTSNSQLFAMLAVTGAPEAGEEIVSSSGLDVRVEYRDHDGQRIDVRELLQGTNLTATVTVRNESGHGVRDLALEFMTPSGWEIHNQRLDLGGSVQDSGFDYQDIRGDRVLTYFPLEDEESISVSMRFNAAYLGRYYLPSIQVEAMYDASIQGGVKGMWVEVVDE